MTGREIGREVILSKLSSIIRGRETFTISKDWTVLQAAQYMAEKRVGAVPVVDGERLVGVFSERDLMTRVVVAGRSADQTQVSEVMTSNIVIGHPEDSEEAGIQRMQQAKCRHLPIVQDGQLLGFISLRDLLQDEIEQMNEEIKLMNEYIHSTPAAAGNQ